MRSSVRFILAVTLALATVMAWLPAGGEEGEDDTPAVFEPLPFKHAAHKKTFAKLGLACADCHPVGLRAESGKVEDLPLPRSICHGCHRGEVVGAPSKAASRCSACHSDREELKPPSHGIGWEEDHAAEARALRAGCQDCHDRGQCVDCHDARGALTEAPHPPGFRAVHGLDARLDGAMCVTCHAAETCVRCHEQGGWPW